MPLPFLTADRTFEEGADDVALPYHDREVWRRPYRPGPWRVALAALILLLASFVLVAALVIGLAKNASGAFASVIFAALLIGGALRGLRMGAWVSARGVRRTGFLRTHTYPWGQVSAVRTVQQPVRVLGLPRSVQGQAVVLTSRRQSVAGPLLTDHSADFLSRAEGFERAADTLEAWADEYVTGEAAGRR
ncbi:PH domain-containing protein [Streptomyces sp. NPDC004959]|uniref:PH domain-containing protein n=1 Tax=unclassified Streptomyces TaxID=2593676 RepID=UPI0004C63F29|nr:PH domain-containing protein [Streptomyces sp. NRRL F-5630]